MTEKQAQFINLRDSRDRSNNLIEQKDTLKNKSSEMHPDDWNLKMKSVEIEILKMRGNILKIEKDLGIDKNDPDAQKLEEEAISEIKEIEKEFEKILAKESNEERESFEEVNKIIIEINNITNKIINAGYTLEKFEDLKRSDDPREVAFYDKIGSEFENSKINERIYKR